MAIDGELIIEARQIDANRVGVFDVEGKVGGEALERDAGHLDAAQGHLRLLDQPAERCATAQDHGHRRSKHVHRITDGRQHRRIHWYASQAMNLSAAEIEQLGERGWFVRDGFLSDDETHAAREEITQLELRPAGMVRGQHDAAERGDHITWLDVAAAPPALRAVCDRLEDLRRALARDAWLPTSRAEIQAAHYPGGGA